MIKNYSKIILIIILQLIIAIGLSKMVLVNNFNDRDYILAITIFLTLNIYLLYTLYKKDKESSVLKNDLIMKNHINNRILNAQKAIIVVRDEKNFLSHANDAFFQTFNYKDLDDFSNKHLCICELFIEKEGVAHIKPTMGGLSWSNYILSHPKETHEVYMLDKYGKERIYNIDLKENVFDEKSMVVFTEITEIKHHTNTFQTLFDNSADGLLIVKENKFLDVNKTLLKMVECPSKEIFLTLTPSTLLPNRQPDGELSSSFHNKMIKECLEQGYSNQQRLQKRLSGETFWCDIAMIKIHINNEDTIYVRWRDIHEYKLLELSLEKEVEKQSEALIASSRLAGIGEMMENITHQWKQPLSLILNIVQLIKFEQPDNKDLAIIEEQTRYLDKTISDFRRYTSHSKNEQSSFQLKDSIEETLNIFKFQAEQHKINIISHLDKDATIKGDIGPFNQAILVILSNAKDALLENKTHNREIKIKTEESQDNIYLSISDNGGGIPKDVIQKIFEPYFTTKFKDKGTGIGLSMTYNIIKQANGTIEVSNRKDGAIFKISLPKIKQESEKKQ